ncbi:MAG: DUF5990 family protein [Acidobacteria bacterium]|nr:DUF5990 family protein [Acidobacteriota bacterium]
MAKTGETELPLRIAVVDPPAGVRFRLQRGARELEPAVRTTSTALTFEFVVRVGKRPDGKPNFLGPFAQGPPARRFVYVNSGTHAGQSGSCWTRRAKIPLTDITWALIDEARAKSGALETAIAGTGRDGGPTCGTVRRSAGWRVVGPATRS